MLIIAIGFGANSDPYSCSCFVWNDKVNPHDMDSVLKYIVQKQALTRDTIDELIVVENDEIVAHYTWENGLGSEDPDWERHEGEEV